MNLIFALMVLIAFLFAGWQQIFFLPAAGQPTAMEILSKAMIDSAGGAVELAIGLVGVMALFLVPLPMEDAGVSLPDSAADRQKELPPEEASTGYPLWVSLTALGGLMALIPMAVVYGRIVSPWILPLLMVGFLGFGLLRRVSIYEVFVEGAKDGFQVALRIIPFLVAILVAVGMLRASGALGAIVGALGSVTGRFGLPAEALPMALMRPLSGSGAYGILASIINDPAIGPDSYTGYLVSTLQGSTETTFYVMAVYFGAVQVRRIRHSLAAALTADVAGVIFAVLACMFFLRY